MVWKKRRENAPFRNFSYVIFLEMSATNNRKLHDLTSKQLVLLFEFYDLEKEISTVPNMRRFFGRYLEQQGMGLFDRNYSNLMNPETRQAIVQGMASEEIKKQIIKKQLLREKESLTVQNVGSFECV
jgi:hypothetical protein